MSSEHVHVAKSSRVHMHRKPNHQRDGQRAYLHAMRKYGFNPEFDSPYALVDAQTGEKTSGPQHQARKLVMKNASGGYDEVSAKDISNDTEYTIPVTIGSQKQLMNLDLDTGSSDFWVFSQNLPAADKGGHNIFDTTKSTTWQPMTGSTWNITYGDGSTSSGTVGKDTVIMGDQQFTQAVEVANKVSSSFISDPSDGLMGCAYGKLNTVSPTPQQTAIESMQGQGQLQQYLFCSHLGNCKATAGSAESESFYDFGAMNSTFAAANNGQVNYTPVMQSSGFWQFSSTQAMVGNQVVNLGSSASAIADTGTTLMLVSKALCEAIYSQIPNAVLNASAGGYVFPADTPDSALPVVKVKVGSQYYSIAPAALKFAKAGSYWFGGIQVATGMPFSIYGDVFLSNVYFIFDQGNNRVGCIQRTLPVSSSTSAQGSGTSGSGSASGSTSS